MDYTEEVEGVDHQATQPPMAATPVAGGAPMLLILLQRHRPRGVLVPSGWSIVGTLFRTLDLLAGFPAAADHCSATPQRIGSSSRRFGEAQ